MCLSIIRYDRYWLIITTNDQVKHLQPDLQVQLTVNERITRAKYSTITSVRLVAQLWTSDPQL